MNKPLDINLTPDRIAFEIAETWDRFKRSRDEWEAQERELSNYIFATDTTKTTNSQLPWKNSTTTPKLCQIRDNLHANYMAALFPNDNWLDWIAGNAESATIDKANKILSYMANKLDLFRFKSLVSQLVYDYIDYGNVFAGVEWVYESKVDPETGEEIPGRIGPRAYRISIYDHVFDPTAMTYQEAPKITRALVTTGQLAKMLADPEYISQNISESLDIRNKITQYGTEDVAKDERYRVDGFGSMYQYYTSGYVELLTFEGDFYDVTNGELYKDAIITVMDRRTVIRNITNPSWFANNSKFHCGWRLRPDNLIAMGPLDNLVGMQYRIDHIENAKADAIDQYIHPHKKIKGYVEDFDDMPGERIICGDDGDVEFLRPPLDQIQWLSDNQIKYYQDQMEEMAGAPKQAMGIRTPGEKTAYEVQTLENAAGRIFQNKIEYFESEFLEPLLNAMLEVAKRNMNAADLIRVIDDDIGVVDFITITKEDIVATGNLKPRGARHFAMKAKLVQELNMWMSSPVGADPAVNVHISGKRVAKLMEESLGIIRFGIVQDNIRIQEQLETQELMNAATDQVDVNSITPTE